MLKKLLFLSLLVPGVALATPTDQWTNAACATSGDGTLATCTGGAAGTPGAFNSFADWENQNLTLTQTLNAHFAGVFTICGAVAGWVTTTSFRLKLDGLNCTVNNSYNYIFQLAVNNTDLFNTYFEKSNPSGAQASQIVNVSTAWVNGTIDRFTVAKTGGWTKDGGTTAVRFDSVDNAIRTVRNCLVHHSVAGGMEIPTNPGNTLVIDNCTFANNVNTGLYALVDGGSATTTGTVRNNLSVNNGIDYEVAAGWNSYTHSGNVSADSTSPETGGRLKTATFTNAAAGDYSLGAGNASILNSGTDLSGVFTYDRVGTTRPQGSAYDVGAYEQIQAGGHTFGTLGVGN